MGPRSRPLTPRARFITFEGGEGGGKTTQAQRLRDALQKRGINVVVTREPGGAPGAEQIRTLLVAGAKDRWDPLAEAMLHFAARCEHVAKTIRPALAEGTWVLCDRFTDSTMAYQGYAQGVGPARIKRMAAAALGSFKPDLTLVLDLPVTLGLRREAARAEGLGEVRYSRMGLAFHRTVRSAFLEIAAGAPQRCVVVNARPSADTVQANIWTIVAERLLG